MQDYSDRIKRSPSLPSIGGYHFPTPRGKHVRFISSSLNLGKALPPEPSEEPPVPVLSQSPECTPGRPMPYAPVSKIRQQLEQIDRAFMATAPIEQQRQIIDASGSPCLTMSRSPKICSAREPAPEVQAQVRTVVLGKSRRRQHRQHRLQNMFHVAMGKIASGTAKLAFSPPLRSTSFNSQRSSVSFWCAGLPGNVPTDALAHRSKPSLTSLADSAVEFQTKNQPNPEEAWKVLLNLFRQVTAIEDMRNLALVNKSMHTVYKNNRLSIVHVVARNESVAGCEFRKWRSDHRYHGIANGPRSEQYVRDWHQDRLDIERLLKMIANNCKHHLRQDTAVAIINRHGQRYTTILDACWRIWTFCTIFAKRELRSDLEAQVDWLKGGSIATDTACSATSSPTMSITSSTMLVQAPSYFAMGNTGGLQPHELEDMYELWLAMRFMLEEFRIRYETELQHSETPCCNEQKLELRRAAREWLAEVCMDGPTAILLQAMRFVEAGAAVQGSFEQWLQNDTGSATTRHHFLTKAIVCVHPDILSVFPGPKDEERPLSMASEQLIAEASRLPIALDFESRSLYEVHGDEPQNEADIGLHDLPLLKPAVYRPKTAPEHRQHEGYDWGRRFKVYAEET